MKKIILFIIPFIALFGCNDSSKKSAFTGNVKYDHEVEDVGTIPEQSIYMLPDSFETQDNRLVALEDFAGKPTVVAMMFTHCEYACPRLVADVKEIQKEVESPGKVNYVLISFDTERDTPEALKTYGNNLKLNDDFTLLHGTEDAVRTLSVLLNVQYQQDVNGNYSHSNIISVLDKHGSLIYQKEGLQADHAQTIGAIKQNL